jgi:uncharacterized cupin superfamily protein
MNNEIAILIGNAQVALQACPIRPHWVLEGNPQARSHVLSSSADGTATTVIWDCSAGRFKWNYGVDETIYFIEGSVTIRDQAGVDHQLKAGDTVFFPAGSSAEWTVEKYIRKVAFLRTPLPWQVQLLRKAYKSVKRVLGKGGPSGSPADMLGQVRNIPGETSV